MLRACVLGSAFMRTAIVQHASAASPRLPSSSFELRALLLESVAKRDWSTLAHLCADPLRVSVDESLPRETALRLLRSDGDEFWSQLGRAVRVGFSAPSPPIEGVIAPPFVLPDYGVAYVVGRGVLVRAAAEAQAPVIGVVSEEKVAVNDRRAPKVVFKEADYVGIRHRGMDGFVSRRYLILADDLSVQASPGALGWQIDAIRPLD